MNSITVLDIGTPAQIGPDFEIEGTIISVRIYQCGAIDYEVGWWDGRTYRSNDFDSFQVRSMSKSRELKVGFIA